MRLKKSKSNADHRVIMKKISLLVLLNLLKLSVVVFNMKLKDTLRN